MSMFKSSVILLAAGVLLLACVYAGCTESEVSPEPTAEEDATQFLSFSIEGSTKVAGHNLIEIDTLGRPGDLLRVGPYLVIADSYGDPPLHVVRASDGAYVRSLGRPGEGPGEFSHVWSLLSVPTAEEAFWAFDSQLRRLTYVDLKRYLADDFTLGEQLISFTSEGLLISPAWIADTLLISSGFFMEGRIGHFDSTGKMLRLVGITPPGGEKIPVPVRQHAYRSVLKTRPDGSLVVLGTRHADQLELYRVDGTRLAVIRGALKFDPKYTVKNREGGSSMVTGNDFRFGFIDLATTQEYIFALYSGRTREAYPGRANFGETVHVFDWSGQLIHTYELDADVISIVVDESGRTLYASQHRPHPAILRYALNDHEKDAL